MVENKINSINEYLIKINKLFLQNSFKISLQNYFQNENYKNIHITYVFGNSSADMDSFISSLLISFFRNLTNNFLDDKNYTDYLTSVCVPIINCKRNDFADRLDLFYIFKKYDINANYLFFIDDVIIEKEFFYLRIFCNDIINYSFQGIIKW